MKELLLRLQKSKFRAGFKLRKYEYDYYMRKGEVIIREEAVRFLNSRIRRRPSNDGKQTPYKNHPVFIAQHATASCCRKCVEKWHKIPANIEMSDIQVNYLADLIMAWLKIKIAQINEEGALL